MQGGQHEQCRLHNITDSCSNVETIILKQRKITQENTQRNSLQAFNVEMQVRVSMGIHYRGMQSEGGATDGGSIM